MNILKPRGATSVILHVFIPDTSSAVGAGLTGLAYNSASLTAYYMRPGASSATAISLVTCTLGTWTSGGFKEVDATHMPGVYELHLPNAICASGADHAVVLLRGATNMPDLVIEIQLGLKMPPTSATRDVGTLEGQMRTVHAVTGGNKLSKDHSAATPAVVHRNEDDSANLVTLTRSVATTVETVTPS